MARPPSNPEPPNLIEPVPSAPEVIDSAFGVRFRHRIFFTRNVFHAENPLLADLLCESSPSNPPQRALLAIDANLAKAAPVILGEACDYFAARNNTIQLVGPPLVLPGGEMAKNDPEHLDTLYAEINQRHIDRHAWIIGCGGGAFLDLIGFATATAHRGCRHLRLPTTTLAQADSGVGVKNGVNRFGKKNFIGAFAPPNAVINDFGLLRTLPARDRLAGCVEGLKVALIRDSRFFAWIEKQAVGLREGRWELLETLIHRCAELHVQHITGGGDPFETGSARPLDFGHWSAHKLEPLTDFRLSHGEAVAIGIALDTLYAQTIGWLPQDAATRIIRTLQQLGFRLYTPELELKNTQGQYRLLEGLEEFREHLGGQLTLTLLRGLGIAADAHDYDAGQLPGCLNQLRQLPPTHHS